MIASVDRLTARASSGDRSRDHIYLGHVPPWASAHERPVLAAFVGSGNTPVKKKVMAACRRMEGCEMHVGDNGMYPGSGDANAVRAQCVQMSEDE